MMSAAGSFELVLPKIAVQQGHQTDASPRLGGMNDGHLSGVHRLCDHSS